MEVVHNPGCNQRHKPRQRCNGPAAELTEIAVVNSLPNEPPNKNPARFHLANKWKDNRAYRALLALTLGTMVAFTVVEGMPLWQKALVLFAVAGALLVLQELTSGWRLYAEVVIDKKHLVIMRRKFPSPFPQSINRKDIVAVDRRGQRVVEVTYTDRRFLGVHRTKTYELKMRDSAEADGVVEALGEKGQLPTREGEAV